MARDYTPTPTYEVDTPLGRMRLVPRGPSGPDHSDEDGPRHLRGLSAMTLGAEAGNPATDATINGVGYSLRVELADYGDGLELRREGRNGAVWHAIDGTRADWWQRRGGYYASRLTDAARHRVIADLVPWLIEWAESHPEAMAEATRVERSEQARRIEEAIEKHERELAELREKLAAVLA